MCNNPSLDPVNIISRHIQNLMTNLSIYYQDIERNGNLEINQGPLLWYEFAKMRCNNPNLDLVNINGYTKFGENLSICSQNIEWKQNFG